MSRLLRTGLIVSLIACAPELVLAQKRGRSMRAAAGARGTEPGSDKARYRLYPGGQDEQELKIQAVLPTPSRSLERLPGLGLPMDEIDD